MATSSSDFSSYNIFVFLFSVPILSGGIWLHTRAGTNCVRFLDAPFIAIGTALMAISLAGMWAASRGGKWLLWAIMVATTLLVLLAFGFTVFAFHVTYNGAGYVLKGDGYAEYRLEGRSNWLQNRVKEETRWVDVRRCVLKSNACGGLAESREGFRQFIDEDVSPMQSGCCRPSYECGYMYRSPTVWDRPPSGPLFNNSDCGVWSNDPTVLCYDCDSCKAGVVARVKEAWKKMAIMNVVFLSFLILSLPYACCLLG